MARWSEIDRREPEFASRARAILDGHKHKVLATLRKDGAPRVSGTEATFWEGELWLGMMDGSMKLLDIRRDPRLALHSAPLDTELASGDVKLSGRALEVTDLPTIEAFAQHLRELHGQTPPTPFPLFRVDIEVVALTTVRDDALVIETWDARRGVRRIERR